MSTVMSGEFEILYFCHNSPVITVGIGIPFLKNDRSRCRNLRYPTVIIGELSKSHCGAGAMRKDVGLNPTRANNYFCRR